MPAGPADRANNGVFDVAGTEHQTSAGLYVLIEPAQQLLCPQARFISLLEFVRLKFRILSGEETRFPVCLNFTVSDMVTGLRI